MHERGLAWREIKYTWWLAVSAPSDCLNGSAQSAPTITAKKLPCFKMRFEEQPWNHRPVHTTRTSELAEWGIASLTFACCCFRISRVEHCDIQLGPMNFDSEWHADLPPLSAIPCSFHLCLKHRSKRSDAFSQLYHFYSKFAACIVTTLRVWKHR